MHAAFRTVNGRPLSLTIPFEDFLASGEMRRQALVNLCSPEDLVLDHLPAFDPDDDDETGQAFAEACEQAVESRLWAVRLDGEDIRFVRRRFLRVPRFMPAGSGPQPAA
mgnify:CR=1 FL=1